MERKEVYLAIDSERDYQIENTDSVGSHIVSNFSMGDTLSAIKFNLDKAIQEWYKETSPYHNTTDLLRKISGLCVQAGEKYGMKKRKRVF